MILASVRLIRNHCLLNGQFEFGSFEFYGEVRKFSFSGGGGVGLLRGGGVYFLGGGCFMASMRSLKSKI